jgi:hypothetical protein
VESIALLAGHERSATTEAVYRHEIRPALTQGAEVMDKIFGLLEIARPRQPGMPRVDCVPRENELTAGLMAIGIGHYRGLVI